MDTYTVRSASLYTTHGVDYGTLEECKRWCRDGTFSPCDGFVRYNYVSDETSSYCAYHAADQFNLGSSNGVCAI